MSNSFWVYVNEPNDKALVHEATCSFCNDGAGMASDKLASNGKWLGPYSQEQAEKSALNSGKKLIRWCGICARKLGIEQGLK